MCGVSFWGGSLLRAALGDERLEVSSDMLEIGSSFPADGKRLAFLGTGVDKEVSGGLATVIVVTSTGCRSCLADVASWKELNDRWQPVGVRFVGVMVIDPGKSDERVAHIRRLAQPTYPLVVVDSSALPVLGIVRLPGIYVLNSKEQVWFAAAGLNATALLRAFLDEQSGI